MHHLPADPLKKRAKADAEETKNRPGSPIFCSLTSQSIHAILDLIEISGGFCHHVP